ncbi:GGDEF domain-containing protein, partial [Thioclava sp. BHET1]
FKRVNDHWGHAAGDCVLIEVAQRLRENLRGRDLLARIGGEEFLIALPDSSLPEARRAAERLRQVIEARPLSLPEGQGEVAITVSIGLAIGHPDPVGPGNSAKTAGETAMRRADSALLAAKAHGRNQVTVSRSAA